MRAVIVGCGRVGAGLAERLARAGHEVTIIDVNGHAFSRLESDFPGQAIRADGTEEDVLRRVGTEGADFFFALTEGDNRNVLAAQLANETFNVKQVVAKVNDPVRAEAYTSLGIATICRTRLLVDALAQYSGFEADPGADGVREPTGHHHHPHGARSGHDGASGQDRGAAEVRRSGDEASQALDSQALER